MQKSQVVTTYAFMNAISCTAKPISLAIQLSQYEPREKEETKEKNALEITKFVLVNQEEKRTSYRP